MTTGVKVGNQKTGLVKRKNGGGDEGKKSKKKGNNERQPRVHRINMRSATYLKYETLI